MITLTKLAKICNVSLSTASKAFSMSSEVNESTREMIFEKARELGCFKKFYNAKYPKYVVAVMCPELRSRHYSTIVSIIQEELTKNNCETCIVSTDFSTQASKDLYDYFNKYSNVDGIICIDENKDRIEESNIPVVCTGNKKNNTVNVSISMHDVIKVAVDHFINNNIKDIAFISEAHTISKKNIFSEYMHKNNIVIPDEYIVISDERMEKGGYMAMKKMLYSKSIPRAVICAYDCMAIGAMRCILDAGLKIPDDIAVIGINNNRESEYLNPPLSSVDVGNRELCKIVTQSIIDKIAGRESANNFVIKPHLIVRKSAQILN